MERRCLQGVCAGLPARLFRASLRRHLAPVGRSQVGTGRAGGRIGAGTGKGTGDELREEGARAEKGSPVLQGRQRDVTRQPL